MTDVAVTLPGAPGIGVAGIVLTAIEYLWPASLPQRPLVDGYAIAIVPEVQRSAMESGRALQRKNFRQRICTVNVAWLMEGDHVNDLRTWIAYTIGNGVKWFEIDLPLDTSVRRVNARFVEMPKYGYMEWHGWRVDAVLEIIDDPEAVVFGDPTVWPSSLPQQPLTAYKHEPGSGIVRSDLPGIGNVRRRSLQALDRVDVAWFMNGTQVATFRSYIEQETGIGVAWFQIALPLDDALETFRDVRARFHADSEITIVPAESTGDWEVRAVLEIVNPPPLSPDAENILAALGLPALEDIVDELDPYPTLEPFFENYENHFG